jgi:hypothetical protein
VQIYEKYLRDNGYRLENFSNMTLKSYKDMEKVNETLSVFYENLPKANSPKTDFIRRISERCNLEEATVRLWVKDKTKPSNPEHLQILSEESGIPVNQLFSR